MHALLLTEKKKCAILFSHNPPPPIILIKEKKTLLPYLLAGLVMPLQGQTFGDDMGEGGWVTKRKRRANLPCTFFSPYVLSLFLCFFFSLSDTPRLHFRWLQYGMLIESMERSNHLVCTSRTPLEQRLKRERRKGRGCIPDKMHHMNYPSVSSNQMYEHTNKETRI